ncbi:hypothetical protein FAES_1796 [Fibrella aestuarina BUZ 2]|uniref:Tyr recombinase domain-containing protein n=1 Tax=Fibrella aestuarina BUZ 2 TaxID=1166018 RepID=I0K6Q3_9BACT|nr:tyrosine-type recombinase/integrase [Fibrella aestuarina]CCG99806.1 hypothetical protein FAES_1796 [Fibrella aestuarina BUZ 2]
MELAILLRLDRLDKDGRAPIHLRVCWQGNKVRLSSSEKVKPDDWNPKTQQVRSRAQFASHINARLRAYDTGLHSYFYERENNGVVVTEADVRAEIERIRSEQLGQVIAKPKPAPAPILTDANTIEVFSARYIRELQASRSESWRESVAVVGGHLNAYRPGVKLSDLTLTVLGGFMTYMQEELDLSDSTLETYVGLLRGLCKHATRSGMDLPPDWTFMEIRRVGDTIQPELTLGELGQLRNATLVRPAIPPGGFPVKYLDALETTRWFFLAAAGTGLRHSDLHQLIRPRLTTIEGVPCVEVTQQKTKQRTAIPLNDDTYYLLKNPVPTTAPLGVLYYNQLLKPIAQQAELTRSVMVGSYYKGQLVSEDLPLHETVRSHMARRTFATLMTAGGMPTRTLQVLMGHASISSTEKYAKVDAPMMVHQVAEAWRRASHDPTRDPNSQNRPQTR